MNKPIHKIDEFFIARLRLTFYYSITAIIILGGSSVLLYNTILSNLSQSIMESIVDPRIAYIIENRTRDILLSRFLTINLVLIIFIVILGFLLTYKTLEPIKMNMQKQKRFIADASHELRTPTAVIISGLEVNLANKNLDLRGAKRTLENTLEEMREFSKLSNDLLDLSKDDTRAEKKYEAIAISELIQAIVKKDKNLAQEKEIQLETKLTSRATVRGNKIELDRVFYNILDNAIKYTPPRGTISLNDSVAAHTYVVTIRDSGSGMSKEILDKIFDPFFRGESSRNTSGAGLGLTLSKSIIENHKGTIAINSQENKGTNVIITLPISS